MLFYRQRIRQFFKSKYINKLFNIHRLHDSHNVQHGTGENRTSASIVSLHPFRNQYVNLTGDTVLYWVLLMYALRAYVSKTFQEIFCGKMKK